MRFSQLEEQIPTRPAVAALDMTKGALRSLGMTVRTFVDPTKTNRVGLIVETPDMGVLQKMLESPEAAAAMVSCASKEPFNAR